MNINADQEVFEQCGLTVGCFKLSLGRNEEENKDHTLRYLTPRNYLMGEFMRNLHSMLQNTGGEEKSFYDWVIGMLRFNSLFPPDRLIRKREF